MKIYKTLSLIAAGTAMCMAASCSTDEPDGPDEIIFGDFVTLTQADATGAVMDYIMPLTGKNVILSTDHKFDPDKFKDGSRIFINYRYLNGNKDNTANGPVTVLNALNVDGGGAVPSQATSEDTDGWASYPVSISYLTLTGPYLNFIYSGNSVGAPESRSFFLDSESLGKEYPELHIIFKSNTDGEAQPYAIRGSYNIASLLNNRFVKGVKVVYRGATETQSQTVEFDRAGLTPSN